MTWWRWPTALALALGLTAAGTAARAQGAQPPFAGDPDAKTEAPRPAIRNWTINAGGLSFSLEFNPGIATAGQLVEMTVAVATIPKTPHPRFGNRIPEAEARFVLEMRDPQGELVGRYRAHPLPLSNGRYGLHFTPAKDGLYEILITGKTAKGVDMRATTKLPVNVWPLPADLQGSGDDAGAIRRKRPIILPR